MSSKGAASGGKTGAKRALRVGVIGAGVMGSNHARVLAGLPDTTLVGVVDPLPAHRTRVTELTGCQTFETVDELIAAGLGAKTGQGMGHISMSGTTGAIESLANLEIGRKVFLHINNSNPALLHGSPERNSVERAGWQIAADGMEITL